MKFKRAERVAQPFIFLVNIDQFTFVKVSVTVSEVMESTENV